MKQALDLLLTGKDVALATVGLGGRPMKPRKAIWQELHANPAIRTA
ncbi:MAG: hypothetical protein J6U22_09600 [Bacteroidaceae bacterium]|nr:hypothetical protein [Bacteroidaceae bacterium]